MNAEGRRYGKEDHARQQAIVSNKLPFLIHVDPRSSAVSTFPSFVVLCAFAPLRDSFFHVIVRVFRGLIIDYYFRWLKYYRNPQCVEGRGQVQVFGQRFARK